MFNRFSLLLFNLSGLMWFRKEKVQALTKLIPCENIIPLKKLSSCTQFLFMWATSYIRLWDWNLTFIVRIGCRNIFMNVSRKVKVIKSGFLYKRNFKWYQEIIPFSLIFYLTYSSLWNKLTPSSSFKKSRSLCLLFRAIFRIISFFFIISYSKLASTFS